MSVLSDEFLLSIAEQYEDFDSSPWSEYGKMARELLHRRTDTAVVGEEAKAWWDSEHNIVSIAQVDGWQPLYTRSPTGGREAGLEAIVEAAKTAIKDAVRSVPAGAFMDERLPSSAVLMKAVAKAIRDAALLPSEQKARS